MRVLTVAAIMLSSSILLSSSLVPSFAQDEGKSPTTNQPQAVPVPSQKMHDDADKGISGKEGGKSGDVIVGEQEEKPATEPANSQPDTKSNQTTTGTSSGASGATDSGKSR